MSVTNKQISYPRFTSRLMTMTFDLLLIRIVLQPVFDVSTKFFYKHFLGPYAAKYEKAIESYDDFDNFMKIVPFENYLSFIMLTALVQIVFIGVYFVYLWQRFGTTPAKYLMKMKVVDIFTYEKPSLSQAITRYLGCFLFPFSLIKIVFDKKNRTFHDSISDTIVIKV